MGLSVDQFAKAVISAGLCSTDEIKTYWNSLPADQRPKDAAAFARALIDREKLTQFQATELLSGSTTPLVLGDYVLLAKIGAGGMGQVFKARHRHMKRQAAIKLLPPALTKDEAAVKRFQREVEAAAKLSHPNIVQTYDAGVQRGVWYLVMEHVEGRDLAGVVASDGPLPIPQAIDCIRQAAQGLAFAHDNGVVHRDIKPANLLLDKKGTVKILDMGLARLDDANQDGLTESGQVMGTVDYMAPEQAFDVHTVDARADIYSLGCTLYRLLTARNMYDAESLVQKLMAHQNKPIPPLAVHRPDVPKSLAAIYERMVAKKPEDRYQTMAEVEAALATLNKPVSATSNISPEPDSKLGSFLQSFSGKKTDSSAATAAQATLPKTQPLATAGVSPTISIHSAQVTTDPISDRSIQVARQLPPQRPRGPWWRNRVALIAAGLGGLLFLALGVWVILKDNDGNKITKVRVPEGRAPATQTVREDSKPQPPLAKAPFTAPQAKQHQLAWAKHLGTQVETNNSVGAKMVLIPPGEFLMGSTDEQVAAAQKMAEAIKAGEGTFDRILKSERPQHRRIVTKPFRMGATEVTVKQFRQFVAATKYVTEAEKYGFGSSSSFVLDGSIPDIDRGRSWRELDYPVADNLPAIQISWNDGVAYCQWLSQQESATVRLPTEAEWEFACRAGSTTQFSFGDDLRLLDKFGWYNENCKGVNPVAMKPPNAFGLHDMHGNLREWCQDVFDDNSYSRNALGDFPESANGSARVIRGGDWNYDAARTRSAFRSRYPPSARYGSNGFRVVQELNLSQTTQR
ncbi:bifunctional serine/threonine-protein kinase/formylglycine-generating enzyme family protein [Anatilimnocola aggregata]|uniref:bifunctional serine/threonine-protein kinase/formylglycine-generating enzyme family protein n=1 Tax=Anatilimnocola aggregata TaxID=2528021 RepID=UPI00192E4F38|nr:bifunctional serine/threonine-protein kinase/formylglycine-generating enzyme family protein [Anatilimnocola aggregata]